MMIRRGWSALACASVVAVAHGAEAQSIASRVSAVRNGTVEMHYTARSGACGDGRYTISLGGSMTIGDGWNRGGRQWACLPGPVRVRMQVSDGTVRDLHTYVGPLAAPAAGVTDLGAVRATDAAAYLLDLARTGSGWAADRSILAAVLADSAVVWRALLAIARDTEGRSRGARNSAGLWLSKFATATLAGHAEDLASDEDDEGDEDDPRDAAVFALSQLRNHEGVDPLIQVARTNRDAHVRSRALFWLGQSGDRKALDLFEEILSR